MSEAPSPPPAWQRLRAAAVTCGLTAAVLSPLVHGRDSFPLSTYPMFAAPRPRAELAVARLVLADGTRRPFPPRLVGGDEILQVAATLAARARANAAGLCASLSQELARVQEVDAAAGAVRVEIARERWDPVAALARGRPPLERRVLASCVVPRR